VWDTDLLLSVITVFPRGLWLIRNFSLVIFQTVWRLLRYAWCYIPWPWPLSRPRPQRPLHAAAAQEVGRPCCWHNTQLSLGKQKNHEYDNILCLYSHLDSLGLQINVCRMSTFTCIANVNFRPIPLLPKDQWPRQESFAWPGWWSLAPIKSRPGSLYRARFEAWWQPRVESSGWKTRSVRACFIAASPVAAELPVVFYVVCGHCRIWHPVVNDGIDAYSHRVSRQNLDEKEQRERKREINLFFAAKLIHWPLSACVMRFAQRTILKVNFLKSCANSLSKV
jgi:hypothetical protein